ncbi:hypothetical protein [Alicyclobacillus mali (ex Roth et al. 2021)]|uniref:hypothetical protein n=1 Tax=Alicyclobacillus mali (ex Roth et al. 2021) TaxID=1123961 RepID=UPI001A8DB340
MIHRAPSFHQGMELYAMGEYNEALRVFLEEAKSLEGEVPQRAGIAYRQAALCARHLGRMDEFDHYMRLAGREFLRASELPDQPAQHIREYSLLAAQCFLAVENLDLSSKSVSRAKTVDVALQEPVAEAFEAPASEEQDAILQAERQATQAVRVPAEEPVNDSEEEERPNCGQGREARDLDAALAAVEARWLGASSSLARAASDAARSSTSSEPTRGSGERVRADVAWASDILEEMDEMHALLVDLQKRMLELERRLHRVIRQGETEGRT